MNMDFGANKTSVEVIKEVSFVGTNLQIFILVLMVNGTKIHGKNLISSKILIGGIIAHIIMMSVLINMVLNVGHH